MTGKEKGDSENMEGMDWYEKDPDMANGHPLL
jgi:hypothetical protein